MDDAIQQLHEALAQYDQQMDQVCRDVAEIKWVPNPATELRALCRTSN